MRAGPSKRKGTMYKAVRNILVSTALLLACTAGQAQQQPTADASLWWKHAVLYEIYPRSFQDSNGDGVGDLNGIAERLGYLQKLGVDAIWIAPMYPSPQVDFGYDISDYENVDPQYGTLGDFAKLESTARQKHIRIVLDMVLNHTSDKHRWFVESAGSRMNAKADWYVWNDGIPASTPGLRPIQSKNAHTGGKGSVVPPNNWESYFGGSAWEWSPVREQFYYHKFYKQQPDLNWRNPAVEAAMFATMRFWLDRGVAGFRLDAIPTLFEDPQLRNEGETGGVNAQGDPNLDDSRTNSLPEVHDVIRRMRAMVASYPGDRVLIGETYLPNTAELDKWYGGPAHDELQLPMDMLLGFSNKLDAATFRKFISEAGTQLHGSQPLFVFDNHDNTRSIDRYAPASATAMERDKIGKLLAAVLLTTKSTALLYQGEELGMVTSIPTRREDVKDPIGITGWPKEKGRDGERTPMQWTAGPQAGFSSDPNTWLPIPASYKTANAASESHEPGSQLTWYERLIALRRAMPALHNGTLTMLDEKNPDVLSYVRTVPGQPSVFVALNFSSTTKTVTLDLNAAGVTGKPVKTLLTDDASLVPAATISLTPYASWIGITQ